MTTKVIITSAFNLDEETQDYVIVLGAKDIKAIESAKAFLRATKSGINVTLKASSAVYTLDDCDVLSEGQLDTIRGYKPIGILNAHKNPYLEASHLVDYPSVIRVKAAENRLNGFVVDIGIGDQADSMAWCTIEE